MKLHKILSLSTLIMIPVVAAGAGSRAYAAPLDIIPTFDSSITSLPNAAAIESIINSAISFYNSNITTPFADPVQITFQNMSSGLGQSITPIYQGTYASFLSALQTTSSGDATDTTALAHLPTVAGYTSVFGNPNIFVTAANLRALGLGNPSGSDGTIGLNTSITNVVGGPYSLFAVTEHEIDEVLGLGSALPSLPDARPEDLYRYDQFGNRSFTTNSAALAYFSLNGTTDLAQFDNQNDGGDFGDWQSNPLPSGVLPKVQDAFATPNVTPSLGLSSPEVIALDAIGYNLNAVAVPEPSSLLLFGAGFGALGLLGWRRKKAQQASA